ncbi:MAG: serine protease [Elusimicrobiales bacterium]|jgi:V8-like Glu-specific endopeptidase
MIKILNPAVHAATILLALSALSWADRSRSIYGDDDRVDYYAASPGMQALADSVVSIWNAADLAPAARGKIKLRTVRFRDSFNLCREVKFQDQPRGPFASGSLVEESLVLTAGHVITDETACKNARIVFGFAAKKRGARVATTIPAAEVYRCAEIVERFRSLELSTGTPVKPALAGADFALIRLDRPAKGYKPLRINRGAGLNAGDKVFVIGYPARLPLKIGEKGTVRDFTKEGCFITDLDVFPGNSGSPVFNAATGLIEGVMVREDGGYIESPEGCVAMNVYAQADGDGNEITKISVAAPFIPESP